MIIFIMRDGATRISKRTARALFEDIPANCPRIELDYQRNTLLSIHDACLALLQSPAAFATFVAMTGAMLACARQLGAICLRAQSTTTPYGLAARVPGIHTFEYIVDSLVPETLDLNLILLYGRQDILRHPRLRKYLAGNERLSEMAAEIGSVSAMRYAHENGARFSPIACQIAMSFGRYEFLKFAHRAGAPFDAQFLLAIAVSFDSARMMTYTIKNGAILTDDLLAQTIHKESTHIECLKLAYHKWRRILDNAADIAMSRGSLTALIFTREKGCSISQAAMFDAAKEHYVGCIFYAMSCGVYPSSEVLVGMAARGDIYMMRWLRAHGCPWSTRVCDEAARAEQWDALRFAISHGCPSGIAISPRSPFSDESPRVVAMSPRI